MKRKYINGKTGFTNIIRISCTAAICLLTAQAFAGSTEAPEPAAAEPELPSNWLDFTVGGAFISGNDAASKRRLQNDDFYGGISSMHWEQEANDITWTLDGHALFGSEDYEVILGAEKADLGYVEAGFRQFRTWYDGSAGYLPGTTPSFYDLCDDELTLDRGEVWFETGLRMENIPELTFRYTHSWRDGEKDSTAWGRPGSNGIAPALYSIDEQRDIFELDITHTFGNTDLGLGLSYEMTNNSDERQMEAVTQTDAYDADLFNAHTYSVSRLNDQMILSFGYAFTTMDTDTDGSSRISDPLAGHDWFDSVGGANFKQHVGNANFWWNPVKDLVLVPSIRYEHEDTDALIDITEIPRGVVASDPANWELLGEKSSTDFDKLTENLDIRYTGIENIVLYAQVMASQADGETNYQAFVHHVQDGSRKKSFDVDTEKYTVGANWYPMRGVSFAAEYYHKDYDSDYDHDLDGFDAHLASQDVSTDDFNVRLTWRALSNLTLVTRYDWQDSTYDGRGIDGSDAVLSEIQSGEFERNIISQSITYAPLQSLYLMGSVSYVWSDTVTAASEAIDSLARSDNDYLTANLTVGYALDERTNITAGYTYYYAENFEVPSGAVGFGTDLEEHFFSVALNRQINSNMIWNLGYGYYNSNDGTSGGNNDFDAHMVSTGLQIRF